MRIAKFLAFLIAARLVHWSVGFHVPYTDFRSKARPVLVAFDLYRPRAASVVTTHFRRRRRNHVWNLVVLLGTFIRQLFPRYAIYVLELENAKYYVGSTSKLRQRIRQHFGEIGGSRWTRLHRPVRVVETYRFVPEKYYLGLEAQVTAQYMQKYGIQNVRGAMFCSTRDLTMEDAGALVGFLGHYNDQSYQNVRSAVEQQLLLKTATTSERGRTAELERQPPALKTTPTLRRKPAPTDRCFYCGEPGHWRRHCPLYVADNEQSQL